MADQGDEAPVPRSPEELLGTVEELLLGGHPTYTRRDVAREVDEILMDHPAVSQCVTLAMPHDKLGEDVAAAIVLREGEMLTEKELRAFASERLAPFKVPSTIMFLDEIPKGATGKLQRIGLAQKLGLT